MMIDHPVEPPAPPGTHLRQHLALEWHPFAHDDIESADTICRDQEKPVGVHSIYVLLAVVGMTPRMGSYLGIVAASQVIERRA